MFSFLAILLSVAMLMTGAPGSEMTEPAAKHLMIDNIVVEYDDEVAALTPTINLGVRTDGQTAVYDFHIDRDEDQLLPLQLAVDAEKLLLLSDTAGVTLKLTQADIAQLMADNGVELTGEDVPIEQLQAIAEGYSELFRMMSDPEQMLALQAESDAIYDEMVDRGEGVEEKLIYQGETLDAVSYEYTIDAAKMAEITEAVYSKNEALSRYVQAYFDMMSGLPEETGFAGVTSYADLFGRMNLQMRVAESITTGGISVQDSVLTLTIPGMETPMQYDIYAVKDGDARESTMTTEYDVEGVRIGIYGTSSQDGAELQGSVTLTVNEMGDAASGAEPTEAGEADDALPEGDESNVGDELVYSTVDYSFVPGELANFEFNIDFEEGTHFGVSMESEPEEGGSVTHMTWDQIQSEHALTLSYDVHQSDADFEVRVAEEGAVPAMEVDTEALLASLGGEAARLYEDVGVRQAAEWLTTFFMGAEEEPVMDDKEPRYTGDISLADARFTYLPEGYRVIDTYVDDENNFASITVSNDAGANIYASLTDSLSVLNNNTVEYYDVSADGEYTEVDGLVISREDNGDYVLYNADDGVVSYSVFPEGNMPTEEILKMIAGIRFD